MRPFPLLLALLGLFGTAYGQGHNRYIECAQFVPGTSPDQLSLEVTVGFDASYEGAVKNLDTVIHIFVGGALLATTTTCAQYGTTGTCVVAGCSGTGCTFLDCAGNPRSGECYGAPGFCDCSYKSDPFPFDDVGFVTDPGGTTVTIVLEATAAALLVSTETDTGDNSTTLSFDGYYQCQPLSIDVLDVSLSLGTGQSLTVDFGLEQANRGYVLLGSSAGSSPGFGFGGQTVPLNFDGPGGYMLFSLNNANGPIFTGTIGVLDGNGFARNMSVVVPPMSDPALAGMLVHHACGVFQPGGGLSAVSNPTPMRFVL